ncbi:uncharacterized protein DS421_1g11980 [Arachis hypogaea]|nr:uncharacterized protein DS421_1g11980 [Arachis hypogaea]
MTLLAASACPLACGCSTEVYWCFIFKSATNFLNPASVNWVPLSVVIEYGTPNLVTMGVKNSQEAGIPAGTAPNGAPMTGNFPCGDRDGGQNSPEANAGTRAGIPVPVPRAPQPPTSEFPVNPNSPSSLHSLRRPRLPASNLRPPSSRPRHCPFQPAQTASSPHRPVRPVPFALFSSFAALLVTSVSDLFSHFSLIPGKIHYSLLFLYFGISV